METKKIVILLFFITTVSYTAFSLFKIITTNAPDFHVFYYSAYDLVNGINPYEDETLPTGLGYPVATSLLYVPLLLLPFHTAQGFFVLLNAFTVPLIVCVSLLLLQKRFSWSYFLLFVSLSLLSFPTKFTLGMGQSNLVSSLLVLGSFYFFTKAMPKRSGILFGLAIVMKPLLGFMILFFLLKQAWKVVFAAMIVIILFVLPTVIIYGFDIYMYYITQVIPHLLNLEGREIYYNQGVVGFIARMTNDLFTRKLISTIVGIILLAIASYAIVKKKVSDEVKFAILLTIVLLVDTLAWQHHFVFLIFPYVVATAYIMKKKNNLFLPVLLVLSYLLVSYNIKEPKPLYHSSLAFLLSHTFFGAVTLLTMLFVIVFGKRRVL